MREFEQSNTFLQSSFSLANLASLLGTNTKYLTYVLNKYYQKDFNTFINELRIDYIIQKLQIELFSRRMWVLFSQQVFIHIQISNRVLTFYFY